MDNDLNRQADCPNLTSAAGCLSFCCVFCIITVSANGMSTKEMKRIYVYTVLCETTKEM